jgi:hypothetical protein
MRAAGGAEVAWLDGTHSILSVPTLTDPVVSELSFHRRAQQARHPQTKRAKMQSILALRFRYQPPATSYRLFLEIQPQSQLSRPIPA